MKTLICYYSTVHEGMTQPDIDAEDTESEWKLFRRVIFIQYKNSSLQDVLTKLISNADLLAAFPNLSKLATILEVLPVTTVTVERSFSSMELVKTRLRSRMGEDTLQHTYNANLHRRP